tara:strand:- start:2261 stop:2719 length:459 start_codon:yes stop_codon:yes gene_type:complete
MLLFTILLSLIFGILIGLLISKYFDLSSSQVKSLERKITEEQLKQKRYRESVNEHFNVTADLIHHMTESYRDVYQQLASGAQELCDNEIAQKIMPTGTDAMFDDSEPQNDVTSLLPPKDYAPKDKPDSKGALSEDYGMECAEKITETNSSNF